MKIVEAGEMFGFRIINVFPEESTEEEWADFADAMTRLFEEKEKDSISA
jgi:hypothetical protein